ncbi:glycosyltransferase family 4 protein [Paenibacillus puerhi]|uniref:glycosyltransferase family 4 protein n=1 Tax=Paenibacillus puerhi TaxID=2692622 RepID=UPI00135709E9|nr:glycosyltransferase family 1 protein [Paenibacillus puerhi]
MRVALFTDTYVPDVNGVAKTLGRWVTYLESRGAECMVFAPGSQSAVRSDQRMVERFYSIPFLLYPECRMAIPNPVNLRKTLRAFAPDLIHLATPFNLGLVGLNYAKRHQVPVVASYHTHFDRYLAYYKLQWMEPILWKYMMWFHQDCRRIYVPSESCRQHLHEQGLKRLEIWPRGVEPEKFRPTADRDRILASRNISPGKFVLLYVGRLAPEKSVDVLMRTFEQLPAAVRAGSHLIVAGDGPLYKPLTERYGGEADITFTGFEQGEALGELYAAADVFLFPSTTETFGNVVLEAMASGTPVIGAAAGGVADTIGHGRTGWLCEPGNIADFVEAVCRMYADRALSAELAREALSYSRRQSWDSIFSRLYASFTEAAGLSSVHERGSKSS